MPDFSKEQNPNYRGGKFMKCPLCGRERWISPSAQGHFSACSRECRKKRVKKVCEVCGKEFEVKKSLADRVVYCSKECRLAGWSVKRSGSNNNNWRGGKVKKTCAYCGREFELFPSLADRECCSLVCANRKMAEAQKGTKNPKKRLFGDKNPFYGKKHSQETIAKIRAVFNRPEVKAKASETMRSLRNSTEFKAKLQKAQSRPEYKEKLRIAKLQYWEQVPIEERRRMLSKAHLASLKANPSSLEIAVCLVLDKLGVNYETQKPLGYYVVDIFIPDRNLVIECDGKYWHDLPRRIQRDKRLEGWLKKHGYQLLRLPEADIKNGNAEELILAKLQSI